MSTTVVYASGGSGRVQTIAGIYLDAARGDALFMYGSEYAVEASVGQDTDFSAHQSFLLWDTSSLGGSTVTNVVLEVDGESDSSTTDFIIEGYAYDWGTTLGSEDFRDSDSGIPALGSILSSYDTSGGWNTGTGYNNDLGALSAFNSAINVSGDTKIVLLSREHRLESEPTTAEYVYFQCGSSPNDARLTITHEAFTWDGPGITLDAAVQEEQSGSFTTDAFIQPFFTADAWVVAGAVVDDFAADAILAKAQAGSFTADAVIAKAQAGSFSTDAILAKTQAVSLDAHAVIEATASESFAADAIIGMAQAGSLTADAVILAQRSGSTTADAVIVRSATGSFVASALIESVVTDSFTADADIFATVSGSFTAGAWLAGTFTADATIRATVESTFTASAWVAGTGVGAFSAYAVRKDTGTGSFTADAIRGTSGSGSFSADAVISSTASGFISADAVVSETASGSLTADAAFLRQASGSFSANAVTDLVSKCIWTTPADGVQMSATPTLAFLMPEAAAGDMHFQIEIDTDSGYSSPTVWTSTALTGWEYWDGADWQPVPQAGVSNTYCGNEARYTVQSALPNDTYYRRVRAGVI